MSLEYKIIHIDKVENTTFTLLCQAQGNPVPINRYELLIIQSLFITSDPSDIQAYISTCDFICVTSIFSPFFETEPVVSKPPTFSNDASTFTVKWMRNSTVALSCQAQAYPVPRFR
jgi:hypothetical protein